MAKFNAPIVSQDQGGAQPSEDASQPLGRAFFERDTLLVARELLGCELWCQLPDEPGKHTRFVVVETEAYTQNDAACHAARYTAATAKGRSAILFGPPGMAYVYLIYGMHHCLNVVTEAEGVAGAVLIRPEDGLSVVGDDIFMTWPTEQRLMADGGRVEIETHAGTRSAWITADMAAPVRVRLKGLGLPARGSREAGHLFVTLTPSSDVPSAAEDLLLRFTRVWTQERLAA